jgi:hypothetical protein
LESTISSTSKPTRKENVDASFRHRRIVATAALAPRRRKNLRWGQPETSHVTARQNEA